MRTSVIVGVPYGEDLARARAVALDTLGEVDGVVVDPVPEAYYIEFGASSVNLDLRYWSDPHQAELRATQDRVVEAIHDAFEDADIEIPFDIVTLDAADTFADAVRS